MTAATRLSTSELASSLRTALFRITRVMRSQRIETAMTLTQLSALSSLSKNGPMSAGELAAVERVQPPSMTKIVAGLCELSLVTREGHPSDRRQTIITLTDAGRSLLQAERRAREVWLTQGLAQLSPDERERIAAVLPLLDRLTDQ